MTARAPVPTQAAALGNYIREEQSRFVQAYADNDDLVHRAAACGPTSFSWAALTAATRGLRHYAEPLGLALVPMLDLFNHDATPTVHWNLTQGQWSAVATAPAEAGEELFLDYGHPADERSHRKFVASYGFSHLSGSRTAPPVEDSEDDVLTATLTAARAVAAEEYAEALESLLYPGTWPPSPFQQWLWCDSCPASLAPEQASRIPFQGSEGLATFSRGWTVSERCQRLARPFGDSRGGSCFTLGPDCPPPRRRRHIEPEGAGGPILSRPPTTTPRDDELRKATWAAHRKPPHDELR